jgi:hypothetical protein
MSGSCPSQIDEVISLLRILIAQNEAIYARLSALPSDIAAASQRGSALSRKDRAALTRLLPAVHAATTDDFFAHELLDRADTDAELREALVYALGPLNHTSARRLGGLLKRGAGIADGALRVVRLGKLHDGALWRVEGE